MYLGNKTLENFRSGVVRFSTKHYCIPTVIRNPNFGKFFRQGKFSEWGGSLSY